MTGAAISGTGPVMVRLSGIPSGIADLLTTVWTKARTHKKPHLEIAHVETRVDVLGSDAIRPLASDLIKGAIEPRLQAKSAKNESEQSVPTKHTKLLNTFPRRSHSESKLQAGSA